MIPPTTRNGLAIATVTDRDKVLLLLRLGLLNLNKRKSLLRQNHTNPMTGMGSQR